MASPCLALTPHGAQCSTTCHTLAGVKTIV